MHRCANLQDNVFHNSAQLADHAQCLQQVSGRRNNRPFDPKKATLKVVAVPSPFDTGIENLRAVAPLCCNRHPPSSLAPDNYCLEQFEKAANAPSAPCDLSDCLKRRVSLSTSYQEEEGEEQSVDTSPCHSRAVIHNLQCLDRAQLIEANAQRLGLLLGSARVSGGEGPEEDGSEFEENDEPLSTTPLPTPPPARPTTPSFFRRRPRSGRTSAIGEDNVCLHDPSAVPLPASTTASGPSTAASRPSTPSLPYPWPRPRSARSSPTASLPASRPTSASSMNARCSVLVDTARKHRKVFNAHCSETSHLRNEINIELMMQSRLPSCRAQSARARRVPLRVGRDLTNL